MKNQIRSLPKVTVGVCVRNSEELIKEAIESIIDQDYPHEIMEVIFVDDGSEDETLSVIESYVQKMDMSTKVFHQEWKGLGPARNVIVNNAGGKYIVWVDGDMVLSKNFVRKQVMFMEKNPKVGIAKARYCFSNNENLVEFFENICYAAVDHLHGGKSTSRTLGSGGSIYRIDAIRQVGGFDDNITGVGEDMDAEFRVRCAGWILFLGSPAIFSERRRKSLKALWDEGFWYGQGGNFTLQNNKRAFNFLKMTPFAGLLAGAWYSTVGYKLTRKKIVFLLPLQYTFKRIAWCCGFVKGRIDRYKHGAR